MLTLGFDIGGMFIKAAETSRRWVEARPRFNLSRSRRSGSNSRACGDADGSGASCSLVRGLGDPT